MGRYLSADTIRLGLFGLGVGCALGVAWRVAGRSRWGGIPLVLSVLIASRLAGRTDWMGMDSAVAVGIAIVVLGGSGAAHLLADPRIGWGWVAAGALVSVAGVWAGVPETGPAVLAGGGLAGFTVTCIVTRSCWAPAAGVGAAAVLGWAALSGAAGRPWAAVGGALCAGMAPWLAVGAMMPMGSRRGALRPWILVAHSALVILASRWIGVIPDAGWLRVAVVAAAGLAVAGAARLGHDVGRHV